MFCSNCGNQLPDGTKFCGNCGTQQPAGAPAEAAPKASENQQPNSTPKKKPNIIVVLAIVLAAFLLGKFVIAPSMLSGSGDDSNTGNQGSNSQHSTQGSSSLTDTNDPAYDAIFDDTYIVHFQTFFNMDMASFASEQENGIICCADYGYKDDVVKQWVETMYIPVSEATDEQKVQIEAMMRSQFTSLEALSCCTVTYKMSTNYLTITFTYANVDQPANYGELYNAGILQANTTISMSATEASLLSQGFIKK